MTENSPVRAATRRPPPLTALTGVRFFAALYVVLYHYGGEVFANADWSVRAFMASGPSAVGLFYVLSGAVLVYSCTNPAGELNGDRSGFWRARFARIYPIYLVGLILDVPFFLSALLKAHDGMAVLAWGVPLGLAAVLLLHAWCPLSVFAWNTPGWSLSAEAFFYAVFPTLLPRVRAASTRRLLGKAAIWYGLALIPPACALAAQVSANPVFQTRVPAGPGGLDLETWAVRFLGFSPITRLPEFVLGMLLGCWLRGGPRRLPARHAATLELGTLVMVTTALIVLGLSPARRVWLDSGLMAPLFVVLVAVLAVGTGPVARILSTRPLQVLGDASYAVYILQEPVVIWLDRLPLIHGVPPPVALLIFLTILIGLAVGCQRFIGDPARVALLKYRRTPSARSAQLVTPRPTSEPRPGSVHGEL